MRLLQFIRMTATVAVIALLSSVGAGMTPTKDDVSELKGVIEALPGTGSLTGDWMVSGHTVHVSSATQIDTEEGSVSIGAFVEVKGPARPDGSIDATRIEVKSSGETETEDEGEVEGTITSLPAGGLIGDWVIGGRTVHVSASTTIDQEHGPAAMGALAEAKGAPRQDGSLDASSIEIKSGSDDAGQIKFKGTIQSFPDTPGFVGDWFVGGKVIHASSATDVEQEDGPVAVGAFVEIEGSSRDDGSIDATKIEVESNVAGDDGRHELTGKIDSLPNGGLVGAWIVSGRVVHVTASTLINQEHGAAAVGRTVEVKGSLEPDGSLTATTIEVKQESGPVSLKGSVESMPQGSLVGDWSVSGVTIHVTAKTKIKQGSGSLSLGSKVKVKGTQQSDGTVVARKIQLRNSN